MSEEQQGGQCGRSGVRKTIMKGIGEVAVEQRVDKFCRTSLVMVSLVAFTTNGMGSH